MVVQNYNPSILGLRQEDGKFGPNLGDLVRPCPSPPQRRAELGL